MRAFEFEGKRRGIRLDAGTWQAVDWLAGQRGVSWSILAHEWATLGTNGPETDGNLTRVIRTSAMQALLSETILSERASMHETAGPIWQSLGMCDDDRFHEIMGEAQHIEGAEDFGAFKLAAGVNEFGKVTFYIEGCIKDCSNLIISTPFGLDQWEAAQND